MATRRTFLGITTGMAVALSIVQSGLSANGTTGAGGWANAQPQPEAPPPPPPATASVTISVYRSPLKIAPEPIAFEVTGWSGFDTTGPAEGETFDPRLHDLVYFWDFGDEGSVYTAPVNVPAPFLNRNIGYGFRVSHTYRTADSPTISVLVVEPSSGKYATASVTLNSTGDLAPIQDEGAYFTGATTIWMDTAGDTTGMPAGATPVTTISALFTTLGSRSTPQRVIMRSGQTFVSPSPTVGSGVYMPTVYFRASDMSGTRPIISHPGGGTEATYMWQLNRGDLQNGNDVWRFARINFLGANDLEAGSRTSSALFYVSGGPDDGTEKYGPRYFEFDDCSGGNADGIFYHSKDARGGYDACVTFNDCHFKNCDFFAFGSFTWLHTTGCRYTHDTNNLCGGFKGDQNNEHGGSIRAFTVTAGVIDGCDYIVRGGWGPIDPDKNTSGQNCVIRWNNESRASRLNMRRCVLEGGAPTVSLSDANLGSVVLACNYTVGECVLLGSWSTNNFFTVDKGGTTIENCIGILPPMEGSSVSRKPVAFVDVTRGDPSSTGMDERILIRNCSMVIEANTADFSVFATPAWVAYWDATAQAQFTNVQTANNVYHAPNLDTPVLASPSLSKATPFGEAQNPGMRTSWVGHNVSIGSIPPGGTITNTYRSGYSGADFGNFPWKLDYSYFDTKTKNALQAESATTFSITRRASDYDITNNTAYTITPEIIYYDRRDGGVPDVMRTAYKTDPNAMALWHPASAPGSAPEGVTLIDLLGRIRPGTLHPDAAAGTPSQGALEPV